MPCPASASLPARYTAVAGFTGIRCQPAQPCALVWQAAKLDAQINSIHVPNSRIDIIPLLVGRNSVFQGGNAAIALALGIAGSEYGHDYSSHSP